MTRATVIVAVVLALALGACQFRDTAQPKPDAVAVLQVIVHDEQQHPVPGAAVVVDGTDPITTDRNGITLLPVYAPVVRLSVRMRGYEDAIVERVPVAAGAIVRVVLKRR